MHAKVLQSTWLNAESWFLSETQAGAYHHPSEFLASRPAKIEIHPPSTVAQACQQAGLWSLDNHVDFDAKDWWYQTQFKFNPKTDSGLLIFSGLATVCDVWLNGKNILSAQNMFISYQVDVADTLQEENTLVLCFRSLNETLSRRRARPRWKTRLVNHQQLRWIRTSLLGRIPGWTPPVAPIGPWQPIHLQSKNTPFDIHLKTGLDNDVGQLTFSCRIISDKQPEAALTIEQNSTTLKVDKDTTGYTLSGQLEINNVERWWPHTHGTPRLYTPELQLTVNGQTTTVSLPAVGFKRIELDQTNDNFSVSVNNQAIFCRGACWTINDIVSLQGESKNLEQTLTLMRDAGANMIRIGGTMIYEQELFYQLCSKLGIMIWQDFMFANMDYPIEDLDFRANVETEIQQVILRLQQHACISIYCGNSEIEQQSAMLGLPESEWNSSLFTQLIPELCKTLQADIPYITSTPTGNILPFHTNKNVTHYYGVGAYLRPVSELRQHDVRFTAECLGFANVPVSKTRNKILNGQLPVTHHPKWKERIPRDTGSGWDFADVRDHYTKNLFNIDPTQMRSFDSENYIALSEVSTGEIMSQVYSEWRSNHSRCSGGLVWFLKDFWSGAGWGIIDSYGLPKACYYYLKRSWQPVNVAITNETLNGLDIHINNETLKPFTGILEIVLLTKESVVIAQEHIEVSIAESSTSTLNSDAIFSNFYDITYSYRFGPVKHSIVAVQLNDQAGNNVSDAYFFPNAELPYANINTSLTAIAKQIDEDTFELALTSTHFLYAVNIDVKGFLASNNFFHLLANTTTMVTLKKNNPAIKRFNGYVTALNLVEDIKIKMISDN